MHHAIVDYIVRLVVATRHPAQHGMSDVAQWVTYGASPRASLGLVAASRALALMRGRDYVLPQDVLDIAVDVLAHRLVLSYDAIADGVPAAHAVRRVLQSVPLPQISPRQRAGDPMAPGIAQGLPQAMPAGMAPPTPAPAHLRDRRRWPAADANSRRHRGVSAARDRSTDERGKMPGTAALDSGTEAVLRRLEIRDGPGQAGRPAPG